MLHRRFIKIKKIRTFVAIDANPFVLPSGMKNITYVNFLVMASSRILSKRK